MSNVTSRHRKLPLLAVLLSATVLAGGTGTRAQAPIPPSISTPDKVETRIGTLDFKDGMPSKDTIAKVYDNLDFTHAFDAFVNTLSGRQHRGHSTRASRTSG